MKWTEKQSEAINSRGKNLLVAAAAGSGKTAVLVERIKKLVIEEKISIDAFLILTFTNAAASEMKEKIVKAINEEIATNTVNRAFLKRQLNIISTANISTFHAFAQEVIRKFFQIAGLDPSLKVCDDAEQQILKNKAMDELFADEFAADSDDFINFLNAYASSKNENAVKQMIMELSAKMESLIEPKAWIESAIENLNLQNIEFEKTELARTVMKSSFADIEKIAYILGKLVKLFDYAGLANAVNETLQLSEYTDIAKKAALAGEFYEMQKSLEDIEFFDITQKKFGKDKKTEIDMAKELGGNLYIKKAKKLQKSILENIYSASGEIAREELAKTYIHANTLKRLTFKYYENYAKLKIEKKLMDFTDIERYAIKILENEDVAREYRDKFAYIFIDEYQDSNPVQEKLISLIKRDDNVFMVGDVKQSIYKFRQAEPRLFEDKYAAFREENSENDKKIDLNANFRSKKSVIDSVNAIFSVLMGEKYDDDAKLNVGVEYQGENQYPTQIHIIEEKAAGEEDEFEFEKREILEELDKYEKEAAIIANIIKDTLGKEIFDVKKGYTRQIELKDIVVLLRNSKGIGEKFQKIFETYDIPSYISDSEGYFDTLEIQIIINFLKVIDNRRNDIPLISMLTSSVFDFSYDEIAKIRIMCPQGTFFDAFSAYSLENEKAAQVLQKLDEWKKLSEVLPISDFIWELIFKSGYYLFVCALPNGAQRQANLRMLIEKARDFQNMNIRGLHEFLEYVNTLKVKSVRIGQVSTVSEDDDVLRIMTIHKSKGLEFPVVIVAGLGRRWKNRKESSGLVFNKDMGFAFEFSDKEKHYKRKTAWQNEIIRQNEEEALQEEKRILYVAFTRAQDKLVLVGTKRIKEDEVEKTEVETDILKLEEPKTYLDMILIGAENNGKIEKIAHDYDEIVLTKETSDEKEIKKVEILDMVESGDIGIENEKLYEEIAERLGFQYEYANEIPLKSKFSVSELSEDMSMTDTEETSLKEPDFVAGSASKLNKISVGNVYHTLLEHWDFRTACENLEKGESSLKKYAEELVLELKTKNILTEDEAKLCGGFSDSVFWLSKSELGRRMANAKLLKKEAPFILDKQMRGQNAIVQGVIDCYFEDEKGMVLLDYKTGRHAKTQETHLKERYKSQIELYREALSSAFEKDVCEAYLVFVEDKKIIAM